MGTEVTIKCCGLTREEDVEQVLEGGADYLGFIVYPKSPRGVSLRRAIELAAPVPEARRVIVDVAPECSRIEAYAAAGFGQIQIHGRGGESLDLVAEWARAAGDSRLWYAPRLQVGESFPTSVLETVDTILLDAFSSQQIGGTGKTGDWAAFRALQLQHPATTWILAGGLNPGNVIAAIEQTGARHIDVNSGVESAPGIKNPEKLRELFRVLEA